MHFEVNQSMVCSIINKMKVTESDSELALGDGGVFPTHELQPAGGYTTQHKARELTGLHV